MGIQENVMVTWQIIPAALAFGMILAIASGFFNSALTNTLLASASMRADMMASSMTLTGMHVPSEIYLQWDQKPFAVATFDGGLMYADLSAESVLGPVAVSVYPGIFGLEGAWKGSVAEVFESEGGADAILFTNNGKQKGEVTG